MTGFLMTNENVRTTWFDRLLARTLLRLIPHDIRPNHVTILRVLLTPLVVYELWKERWEVVIPLFLFTALTDAIDGALARTRKQITLWGTVADPIADKLLIGSVIIVFVAREINPILAAIIVTIEALTILGALLRRRRGSFVSANAYGKVKMGLQVAGVSLLLLAKWSGIDLFVPLSTGTLAVAIVFALISLVTYGL